MKARRVYRACLSAAAVFCAACSTPPHTLIERGGVRVLQSRHPPATAYRLLVEGTRRCYSRFDIGADYFTDTNTGRVSMSAKTALNVASLYTAEVRPQAPGAVVTVHHLKGAPDFAAAIESWLDGNPGPCPFMLN